MRKRYLSGLVVACVLAAPGFVSAQRATLRGEPGSFPVGLGEPIPLGLGLFSVAADLSWQSRDNIFYTASNPVDDSILLARARFLYEIPVSNSKLTFRYTPQYRNYGTYENKEKMSHFFNFGGVFEFANGLKITAAYDYTSGNQETQVFDPGGEVVFNDSRFTQGDFHLTADYWLSPVNGVSLEARTATTDFDEPGVFFPFTRDIYGVGWLHQVSPTLVMAVRYRHEKFDPEKTITSRSSTSDEVTVGFRGQVNPVLSAEVELGGRSTDFDKVPGGPAAENYSGFVARGGVSWELAHGGKLSVNVLRQDFPSNFGSQSAYVTTGSAAAYDLNLGKFFGKLNVRVQSNDYNTVDPSLGLKRKDDVTSFGASAGYRISPLLSVRATYGHEKRDSNSTFGYESNVILVGLVAGF